MAEELFSVESVQTSYSLPHLSAMVLARQNNCKLLFCRYPGLDSQPSSPMRTPHAGRWMCTYVLQRLEGGIEATNRKRMVVSESWKENRSCWWSPNPIKRVTLPRYNGLTLLPPLPWNYKYIYIKQTRTHVCSVVV